MKKLLQNGAVTSRYPRCGRVSPSKPGLIYSISSRQETDASGYMAVSLRHAMVRITRDVALARANHEALIKRMPFGQHPRIGYVSVNVGTLAASLLLEAVLYQDDKQFFMLCFSVSAHCSTSGCFRLQAWRSSRSTTWSGFGFVGSVAVGRFAAARAHDNQSPDEMSCWNPSAPR
jgi:hypothetical protein